MGPLFPLLLLVCASVAATPWTLSRTEQPLRAGTDVRETRWIQSRPPGGVADRIQVHRYRGRVPAVATLVYLPGTNMNGEAVLEDADHNLWIFLAQRGVEVYALDYRTHFVSDGTTDFAFMKTWGIGAFVDDARQAVALARRESGRSRVFVAGFSRGVSLAWAWAATEPPEAVAGLIALDGAFKKHAPANKYDLAGEREKWQRKGVWASDVGAGIG